MGFKTENVLSLFSISFLLVSTINTTQGRDVSCDNKPEHPEPQHYMVFQDEDACCGKEKYQLGTGSDYTKYFKNCNVEPKNETMSLEDSYWAVYDCTIKAALGSKELTQTSFVELLAQKLSDSKRSAILSLANDMKDDLPASSGNIELKPIKTYWKNYFDAEYQVCSESWEFSDSSKEGLKRMWDPSERCLNGKYPNLLFIPVNYEDVDKCIESFKGKNPATLNSSIPFEAILSLPCLFINGGYIKEDDLSSSNFDYKALVANSMPNFFSKSLKGKILNDFLKNSRVKYDNDLKTGSGTSADIPEISMAIMKSQQGSLGEVMNTAQKDLFLNIFTIYDVAVQVFQQVNTICNGPSDSSSTT